MHNIMHDVITPLALTSMTSWVITPIVYKGVISYSWVNSMLVYLISVDKILGPLTNMG